ncbi:MAG: hypothetical protein ACXVPU_18430 [Bacteroidia bacterium]
MDKEKWINDVMNSLDGIKSPGVNPFLYNRILEKIGSGNSEYAPMKLVWLAAASFILLIALNFTIIKAASSAHGNKKNELQKIAADYQLLNENSINYNQ